jgi:hypothetical protein
MRKPMIRALFAFCLLAAGVAALWAGSLVDVPVTGKKLLIKDPAKPEKRRAIYLSKDESFSTAGIDPTVNGVRFMLLGQSPSQFDEFPMPAGGWKEKKPGRFVYNDKDHVNGPVVAGILRNGIVKVVVSGSGMTFGIRGVAGGQGPITANLQIVNDDVVNICTTFPGMDGEVKKNDGEKGLYLAVNAEAPTMSCAAIID